MSTILLEGPLEPPRDLPLCRRRWSGAGVVSKRCLLVDHAFLEKKAANNAMDLMTHWPDEFFPGWVETMTSVARRGCTPGAGGAAAHKARRKARTDARNPYANELRLMVRKGEEVQVVDRLIVSALIEVRSCERFAVLAAAAEDAELGAFYKSLFSSELGHYKVFLKLALKVGPKAAVERRWEEMLGAEARILASAGAGPANSLGSSGHLMMVNSGLGTAFTLHDRFRKPGSLVRHR